MKKTFILFSLFGVLGLVLFPGLNYILAKHNNTADDCQEYCQSLGSADPLDSPENQACICNPLEAAEFGVIIDNIIDFIFKIAVVLAPLMVVVGGFLFLTAGGNPQQIDRAKNLIIWTAIGFLIVLLSKGILAMINKILGVRGG